MNPINPLYLTTKYYAKVRGYQHMTFNFITIIELCTMKLGSTWSP